MAELFNYTNGIRGARVDPLLSQNQNKKVVPEARARRNSFSSKENSIIAAEDSTATIGRKKLTTEFEKTHANGKNQAMETRRKSNPDAYLKQTTQERVSLGKKMNGELAGRGLNTAAANCVTLKPADLQQESAVRNINNKSSSDHFQKSSMVPAEGASPKKAGLRFMAGPPEFVADPYVPKKLHTHAVAGARGKDSTMGGLIKQQDNNNNFSVASSAATSTTASVARRNSFTSSASYNIITGQ